MDDDRRKRALLRQLVDIERQRLEVEREMLLLLRRQHRTHGKIILGKPVQQP